MNILNNKKLLAIAVTAMLITSSCNKGFDDIIGTNPTNTGVTIGEKLNVDPNYSIFRDALIKYGLINQISNAGNAYTVFAMDNATMTAVLAGFSLTPATFVAAGPGVPAALAPVFQYHIVPTSLPAANIPSSYSAATPIFPANIPNAQMPTAFILPGGNPLVRMSVFPARNGANAFANTVPIVQPDVITGSNGVIHRIPAPLIPPSQTLKQSIQADPNHTYLLAAIVRADSGQVGLNRLDSAINFGVANLTIFAPTNAAFQTLLVGAIAQALIAQGVLPATAIAQATALASTPAVFSNPALFSALTAQTVRGIVVYHILGARAFSVNLPLANANLRTLLNTAIPAHPGFLVDRTTPGVRLLGLGNAGMFSNVTATDRHAVNGVWHVIDRVMLPQ